MPTRDPSKNVEYVKKSLLKKKEALGIKEYNRINADTEQRHRDKLKTSLGVEEYKKQQAEYMKEYRAKKKVLKKDVEKKAINTIADAVKARIARRQMEAAAIEKATKTANKLTEIGAHVKVLHTAANKTGNKLTEIGEKLKQSPTNKRGRPAKSK